jgi:hypothetical protein
MAVLGGADRGAEAPDLPGALVSTCATWIERGEHRTVDADGVIETSGGLPRS